MHYTPTGLPTRTAAGGFTVIELMITLTVIAILVGLALPNYRGYVMRANRSEAVELLLSIAACQERVYTKFHSYDADRCLDDTTSFNDHYIISINPDPPDQEYTLTATAQGSQTEDSCGNLTLTDRGERGSSGASDAQQIADCWRGRSIQGSS